MIKKSETIAHSPIVLPAASPKEAKEAWQSYLKLKEAVQDKEDIQMIKTKEGVRPFLKKSYWRKIATFFNISVKVAEERREDIGKNIAFHFICKAIAPNGRFAIGAGSCDVFEKGYRNTFHNVRATAETRAFNRAVSNLVGGGEVSAEEMVQEENKEALATEKQIRAIFAIGKSKGLTGVKTKESIKKRFELKSFKDLTKAQASEAIETANSA